MKIGIQNVFPAHQDYNDRDMYKRETRLLIEAEGMGFDIIWPVEHHFFDYSMCPDNMQYLSYIAARTERMELGTGAIPRVCEMQRCGAWRRMDGIGNPFGA